MKAIWLSTSSLRQAHFDKLSDRSDRSDILAHHTKYHKAFQSIKKANRPSIFVLIFTRRSL